MKFKRTINELMEFGVINIDKPAGPTSFRTAEMVGRILGVPKFAHFGTLDPMVTGVLPVAINRACKLSTWFMRKDKTYVGVMKLHKDISEADLKKEMKKFVGKIIQLPPIKSRVKRQEREREVYSWDLLELDGKNALFETKVEAGTYIRKLIHDLGLKIGGAHMIELRRTQAGIFEEKDAITLYELEEAVKDKKELAKIIQPGEIVTEIMSSIKVKVKSVKGLLDGKPIYKHDLEEGEEVKAKAGENVAVFAGDRFIEVAEIKKEGGLIAKAKFVFN